MINPVAIAQIAILLFVFVMLLSSAAVMVYVERKVAARIQQRVGPIRCWILAATFRSM